MGDRSFLRRRLKFKVSGFAPEYILIGILTRPKLREPDHIACAIMPPLLSSGAQILYVYYNIIGCEGLLLVRF
jgi:hypothetical protein